MTPDTIGVAADVPENVNVQSSNRVVVAFENIVFHCMHIQSNNYMIAYHLKGTVISIFYI